VPNALAGPVAEPLAEPLAELAGAGLAGGSSGAARLGTVYVNAASPAHIDAAERNGIEEEAGGPGGPEAGRTLPCAARVRARAAKRTAEAA